MMSRSSKHLHSIALGDSRIEYSVNRSDRRRWRLVVSPDGRVEARVSRGTPDDSVREFIHRQRKWILRQQIYFEHFRPREPKRRYVAGETFRYLGRQYCLEITHGDMASVKLKGRRLFVATPSKSSDIVREAVQNWYKERARIMFARRSAALRDQLSPHGIPDRPVEIRRMVRRWGSCTPRGRILLNPYLVIAATDCMDYVIVHEMCHILHPRHDDGFYRLLTTVMPDWPRRRSRLETCGPYLTL